MDTFYTNICLKLGRFDMQIEASHIHNSDTFVDQKIVDPKNVDPRIVYIQNLD